ncbi:MAG: hypothetical protein ACLSBH_15830 [Coprobacillus cateniformis]
MSYPDISLVSSLCEILEVSEHELITCSEDFQQRETERQAKYFRRLMKTYSVFFYICYAVSLFVCMIVNLILEQQLSWFFIVLSGEMVAFTITSLPNLVKGENKQWIILGSFYISLNLLLLTSCIYTGGDWFFVTAVCLFFGFAFVVLPFLLRDLPLPSPFYQHKTVIYFTIMTILLLILVGTTMFYSGYRTEIISIGLPVTLVCVFPFWLMMFIIRYLHINSLWKTAICLFIIGVFSFAMNSVLMMLIHHQSFAFSPINLRVWNEYYLDGNIKVIIVSVFLSLSIALTIGGISLEIKKKSNI